MDVHAGRGTLAAAASGEVRPRCSTVAAGSQGSSRQLFPPSINVDLALGTDAARDASSALGEDEEPRRQLGRKSMVLSCESSEKMPKSLDRRRFMSSQGKNHTGRLGMSRVAPY